MRTEIREYSDFEARVRSKAMWRGDYIAPLSEVSMRDEGRLIMHLGEGHNALLDLREQARRQMATHLHIPIQYWRKMEMEDALPLLADNVNTWLERHGNERRMFRTSDGSHLRAFLSDRYLPIDDDLVAERLLNGLLKEDTHIRQMIMTEERTDVTFSFGSTERMTKVGALQAGIRFTNSEVGQRTLTISPIIFTCICSNGAVMVHFIRSLMRRHIGARFLGDSDFAVLTDATAARINDAFWSEANDYARMLTNEENWEKMIAIAERAGEQVAERGGVVDVTDRLQRIARLTNEQRDSALTSLAIDGPTRWGVSSALTLLAQKVEDTERGLELEELGGRVLSDDSLWREVA